MARSRHGNKGFEVAEKRKRRVGACICPHRADWAFVCMLASMCLNIKQRTVIKKQFARRRLTSTYGKNVYSRRWKGEEGCGAMRGEIWAERVSWNSHMVLPTLVI